MKYLLDTNIVIDYFKGNPRVVSFLQKAKQYRISLSVISAGEILEGLVGQPGENRRRHELEDFMLAVKKLDVNMEVIEVFARIRAKLRDKGKLINNFDILIAATAIKYNLVLVTKDKDFERIEGLRLRFIA